MKFTLFAALAATAAASKNKGKNPHHPTLLGHNDGVKVSYPRNKGKNPRHATLLGRNGGAKSGLVRNFDKRAFIKANDVECSDGEETCYEFEDYYYNAVGCESIADGGCPCPEGEVKCGADIESGWPGYCTPLCCGDDEELCYDDDWNIDSCAAISEGGCPCPGGHEKCGASEGYPGYCTNLCCADDEETCYDDDWNVDSCAPIAEGGCPCPEGEERCGADLDHGYTGYCTTVCCGDGEETCYDENYNDESCAAIAEGGCPCPEGEEKCGADLDHGYTGYCTSACCGDDEETCYDYDSWTAETCAAWIADGGCPCPEGEVKCGADAEYGWSGYCTTVCCGEGEETCYDDDYNADSCAAIADGGCPCPEGEEKCGADVDYGWAGWCTPVCCGDDEETCYNFEDYSYDPVSCAAIAEGGCPCPEGQEKCGASEGYAGYCINLCCADDEESCYDDNYNVDSCAPISEGGCSCPEGQEKCMADIENGYPGYCTSACCDYDTGEVWCYDSDYNEFCAVGSCPSNTNYEVQKNNMAALIMDKGTPEEIAHFQRLTSEQKKLSPALDSSFVSSSAKSALERKVFSLFLTVRKENNQRVKNEVPFFMTS